MISLKKIESIKKSRSPFKVWDILVFGLAIVLTIALTFSIFSDKGQRIEVTNDGARSVYSLEQDREIIISAKLTIVIEGGKCYVKNSSCTNKTCEHMGKISRVSESIVCAQNHVVIQVLGESSLAGTVGQG